MALLMSLLLLPPAALVPPPGNPSGLDGLWTRVPMHAAALHDALRVRPGGRSVACEHGGWLNMTELRCPWQTATLTLRPSDKKVSLEVPGRAPVVGKFVPLSSSLCNWTDAAPGSYWMPVGGKENNANAHDNTSGAAPYTPSCSAVVFEDGETWIRLREVRRVQIASMSHLDVGYTGSMSYTLNSYFSTFFPRAVELQANLTRDGHPEKLHYITHAWLVYLYLHCGELPALGFTNEPVTCPTPTAKAAFVAAVRAGTITWHAGPMNQQVEWMTARMFKFAVNVSHALDDFFAIPRKTTLSQRDVLGMTRGVVPLLAERNVSGITVGENGGFCAPNVPYPLFRWAVGGASVVAAYHPGGYPDMYACPHANMQYCTENNAATMARRDCLVSGDQAFCFAFRTDNTGPPESTEEVIAGFKVAATQFPGASIEAGSLDDFFQHAQSDETLPVVTEEVGDIWIVGIGSDPKKASTVRRMQRAWGKYDDDESLAKAATILLKLTEHVRSFIPIALHARTPARARNTPFAHLRPCLNDCCGDSDVGGWWLDECIIELEQCCFADPTAQPFL